MVDAKERIHDAALSLENEEYKKVHSILEGIGIVDGSSFDMLIAAISQDDMEGLRNKRLSSGPSLKEGETIQRLKSFIENEDTLPNKGHSKATRGSQR